MGIREARRERRREGASTALSSSSSTRGAGDDRGIDTCLRGVLDYAPPASGWPCRGGRLERPRPDRAVADCPPGASRHRVPAGRPHRPLTPQAVVPHSARLIAGLLRYRWRIPRPASVQAHRVDIGFFVRLLFRVPLVYCIHTQRNGLLGPTSDSFWRFTGGLHERLDRAIARRAERVIVFNPAYAEVVRQWNPRTIAAPTWFDPAITAGPAPDVASHAVLWVGRLEVP